MKRLFWLLLCLMVSVSIQAQDVISTQDTVPNVPPLATAEPTLAIETPQSPPETPLATLEITPTETPALVTPIVTQEPTTSETPIVTQEAGTTETPIATQEPVITPDGPPTELPLLYKTSFESDTSADLSAKTGWTQVLTPDGQALQSNLGAVPVMYKATLMQAAVEARFLLNQGEGQLLLRGYSAGLNSSGRLTLYQNQVALTSGTVVITPRTWNSVRLSMAANDVQVSVNGVLVIDYTASAPLSDGQAGFAASNGAALRLDDFAVYGVATTGAAAPTPIVTPQANSALPMAVQPPSNLQAVLDGTTITLTWQDNSSDETSFEIINRDASPIVVAANTTTTTITNVPCGIQFRFQVRAVASPNMVSAFSEEVAIRTTPCTPFCDPTAAVQRVSVGTNSIYQSSFPAFAVFSYGHVLSGSGRYAAFISIDALTDTPALTVPRYAHDIYRYDTLTCTTVRVNVDNAGQDLVPTATLIDVTADGSLALFTQQLLTDYQAVLRDLNNNTTTMLLPQFTLSTAQGMTKDGRYILMTVGPQPLPGYNDTNSTSDLVIYDRQTATFVPLIVDGNNAPLSPQLNAMVSQIFSANGKLYVIFLSNDVRLVPGRGTGLYLRNVTDGITTFLSIADNGTALAADFFWSYALNNNVLRIPFQVGRDASPLYLRQINLNTPDQGITSIISRASGANGIISNTGWASGAQISANGRWVAFESYASSLAAGDTNAAPDVFVRDLVTNTTVRIMKADQTQLSKGATLLDISDDGQRLLIWSATPDLVANDTNNVCPTGYLGSNTENCMDEFVVPNPLYVAPAPPDTPSALQAAVNGSTITLTWQDNSSNETGFEIQGSRGLSMTTAANVATLNIPNVDCGLTVQYRVRAVKTTTQEMSVWSAWLVVSMPPCIELTCDHSASVRPILGLKGPQTIKYAYTVWSYGYSLSADGRYAGFSSATNLTNDPQDALEYPPAADGYRYDTQTCTIVDLSVDEEAQDVIYDSTIKDMSADGSLAVLDDKGVMLRDLNAGTTTHPLPGRNGRAFDMTPDGRYLLVELMPKPPSSVALELYVYDTVTNALYPVLMWGSHVSRSNPAKVFTGNDKVYVLFQSGPGGSVFISDVMNGITTEVSLQDDETTTGLSTYAWDAAVVGSTLYIPFGTEPPYQSSVISTMYLRTVDLSNPSVGTTTIIGRADGANGAIANGGEGWLHISANGRWVAFSSEATNLVPDDTNGVSDIFVRDLLTDTNARIMSPSGTPFSTSSSMLDISDDGSTIFFYNDIPGIIPSPLGWDVNFFIADNPLYEANTLPLPPEPLAVPTLISPPHQTVTTERQPTLTWGAVADATQYVIQMDDEPTFATPLPVHIVYGTTSYTPDFLAQGRYYWRVRAASTLRSSDWSNMRSLTINIAQTPAPETVLTSLYQQPLKVRFTWADVKQANETYTLQINSDSTFTTESAGCEILVSAAACDVSLAAGEYYWRVQINGETFINASFTDNHLIINPGPPPPPASRAPTLTAPLNNDALSAAEMPVVLRWSWGAQAAPTGGPFTYALEIAANATFETPLMSTEGLSDAPYTPAPLADGVYYWRVQSINAGGLPSVWSAPFRFTVDTVPPAAPLLLMPLAGAVVSTPRPAITWKPVSDATRYRMTIKTAAPCDPMDPQWDTQQPLKQDTYIVCLWAYDASGNISSAASRWFSVFLGTGPAHNTLLAPTIRPIFRWTAAPDSPPSTHVITYRVQIDSDTDPSNGVWLNSPPLSVNTVTYILPNPLPAGTYYWRIVRFSDGLEDVPVTSRYFTLLVGTLTAGPGLTSPTVNQVINTTTALTWTAAPSLLTITDYEVAVSRSALFTTLAASGRVSASGPLSYDFVPPAALNRVAYVWRVRGLSNGMAVTNWSTRTFIVDNVAPLNPVITTPTENALVATPLPKLTWAASVGAVTYRVRVQDGAGTDIIPDQIVTSLSFTLSAVLPQDDYVFRVQAGDGLNWSAGTLRHITVRLGMLPAHNAMVLTPRPTFTWTPVPNATRYELQIDRDPYFDAPLGDASILRTITLGDISSYTLSAVEALPVSGRYYWRIQADNLPYPAHTASHTLLYAVVTTAPANLQSFAFDSTVLDKALNASDVTPSFSLAWTPLSPAPLAYEVQINPNIRFPIALTQTFTAAVGGPLTLTSGVLTDGLKYWRVRAIYNLDSTSVGVWSATASFALDSHAPLAPLSPAPLLSRFNTLTPRLVWAISAGAVRYRLTIIDDKTGLPLVGYDKLPVIGTAYVVPLAAHLWQRTQTTYRWLIQAEDAAGNLSTGFAPRQFTLFIGTAPTAGQFTLDPTPLMTWTPHWGGSQLWLQIATDAAMTQLVVNTQSLAATSTRYTLPTALPPGRYYWRVIAASQQAMADDVAGQPFSVVSSLLSAAPVPVTPANASVINKVALSGAALTWTAPNAPASISAALSGYQVEIARLNTFTAASLVTSQIVSVPALPLPALADGLYYWRVRGLFGPTSEVGPLSAPLSVIIDQTAPPTPVLKMPQAGSLISTTRQPVFVWGSVAGATQYRLEIARDSSFSALVSSSVINAPTAAYTLTLAQVLGNGVYYWRVWALDVNANSSPASLVRRLVISLP